MSEDTLTDGQTTQESHHSTTIEIPGNGQVNAAFEDTETNIRSTPYNNQDVANGSPVNQEETPSTPLAGHRDINHHMNGTATSETAATKVNGVVEPKNPNSNEVKDVAEAVNLELVNMQPFNNGIPVKKESTELDIGDPYDEYFVPVNQHKKYMRGEKLYVTQDKRRSLGGGKRKCCWGLLSVIVLGIIVAILIGVLLSQDSNSPVKSRTFNSDIKGAGLGGVVPTPPPRSTQQPPRPTTDVSEMYLQRVVEGELTIDNMEFTPGLADQNTSEFKTLATSLEEELKKALFDRQILLYGSSDITVRVLEFKSGSVIVLYRVGWQFKPDVHNPTDPLSKEALKTRLQVHLRGNDGFLYNYRMPISSLKSNRVLDNCQINNNNCSNMCHFNSTTLRFTCSCPADYILDSDRKTCIENYIDLHHHDITTTSSTENIPVVEHHTPIVAMPDPTMEPSEEPEPSTEHHMPQIPLTEVEEEPSLKPEQEPSPSPEPEPYHEPEISTEREELTVPSQEPETIPDPEPSHEPDSSSEQSVSSESSSQEYSSSSEAEFSREWYPEPEHEYLPEINSSTESKAETSPNTEPVPVPEEPESTSKSVPIVNFIPPVTEHEMLTEHEMSSESDNYHYESSSEKSFESIPEPLTEYNYHESSEEPKLAREEPVSEEVEHFKPSEESKPLSELMATTEPQQPSEESLLDHPMSSNETEHETKIISGYVPITAHTTMSSATTSNDSQPENAQQPTNQTEHGAGSMRSLNLEHSTGHIIQTNEVESSVSNNTVHPDEMMNSTQPVFSPIESDIKSIITTELPTTMEDNLVVGAVTSMEPGSTDINPAVEHSNEHNETIELFTKLDHSDDESNSEIKLNPTEQVHPSTETYHVEEIKTLHESIDSAEKNPIMQTEIGAETTFSPSNDVMSAEPDVTSSTSTTEKQPLVISSSDITIEMGKTETPDEELSMKTTLTFTNNDTMIGEGEMKKEFEFDIAHVEEPTQSDNDTTVINEPITTVFYKHEIMNTTDTVTIAPSPTESENVNTEPDMQKLNVSIPSETTTPHLKLETVKNEQSDDVTTHLPINLDLTETPVYTTLQENMNQEEKELMSDQKVTLSSTEMVKETNEDVTTVPPTTIEHFGNEESKNIATNEESTHQGLMELNDSTTSEDVPTTMKHEDNEEGKIVTTTVKNINVIEVSGEVEITTDSSIVIIKDELSNLNHVEPVSMAEKESSIHTGENSTKSMLETTERDELITTFDVNVDKLNETIKTISHTTDEEKVTNFLSENKTEVTTLKMEIPIQNTTTDTIKTEEMAVEITTLAYNKDFNATSSEQPQIPLHTPNSSPESDEMPMISITHIPDLSGPFSVDTIIDHSTPYIHKPEEDVNQGVQINHTYHFPVHEDDPSSDLTADTLNSLDDDYNEEDKKKYYKPAKSKNFKNFKIQEVNIPIDSLADETTKDIQHSKDIPESTSKSEDMTTIHPTVIREEITSNDAFTTLTPLFKEEKSSTKQIPSDLPHEKDEHLNVLFFSNEAETTMLPIFGKSLNITAKPENNTQNFLNNNNHLEDGINHLETKVVHDNKEEITTEMAMQQGEAVLQNTATGTNDSMSTSSIQPEIVLSNDTSNLNATSEPEVTTMKLENGTETSTMKLVDEPTPRHFNSSGLLEILNPSKKCATGQFACADGSGCIKAIQRCDAIRDCEDGSDELNCEEQGCLGNFQCKNRHCLKRSLVCDSISHCTDGSDESDCENWKCLFDEVRCPNSGQCIPFVWKCDGKGDCRDNADEFGCRDSCANDEFFCPEGRCIPHNNTCNAINDCLKGEDEMHCSSA